MDELWKVLSDGRVETWRGVMSVPAAVRELGDDGTQVLAYAQRRLQPLLTRAMHVTRGTPLDKVPTASEVGQRVEELRVALLERSWEVSSAMDELQIDGVMLTHDVAVELVDLLRYALYEVALLDRGAFRRGS